MEALLGFVGIGLLVASPFVFGWLVSRDSRGERW